ncbi:MAG: glycosyltransferase, partial [Alphaproteobacteria bacterium]|nr:glycosyltransferase [Alphaproteobacteria bacterium]
MSRRAYFDGLNLALPRGTGIATYTRLLANIVRDLGYETGIVYSSPNRPPKNPLMREISFFDYRDNKIPHLREMRDAIIDQFRHPFGIKPSALQLSGMVVTDQFQSRLPSSENLFIARNLFANARRYFSWSGRFTDLQFEPSPDILHCTYQLPIRAKGACNVYTIHDLVPLRLPFTTLDNKRQTYRMLRKIGAEADHIVTVSEHSKRDIIELLGVDEKRVTNTYEAVEFPREFVERPDDVVAEQLRGSFGLTPQNYLLFYGALEPKKNVQRLIDAFMLSAVDIPLVITGAGGWGNQAEAKWLSDMRAEERAQP